MNIKIRKYNNYLFYLNGIKNFFVPMAILGLILGSITEPKFLILGMSPVILMGIIATVISEISIICIIIVEEIIGRLEKRDKDKVN